MKDKLSTVMPLFINSMTRDGTSRDFEAMLDDFRSVFKLILPEYTSIDYEDDYGIAIVEVILWILDNLNYQLDFYVQQRTRKYCRTKQSLQDILEWYNYYLPSKSPAKSEKQKFYLSTFPLGHSDGLLIPKGTLISTTVEVEGNTVYFETDTGLTLDKKILTSDADGTNTIKIGTGNTEHFQIGMMCEIKNDTGEIVSILLSKDNSTGELSFDKDIPVDYTVISNSYVAMLEGYVSSTEGRTYVDDGIMADEVPFEQFQTTRTGVIDNSISMRVNSEIYNPVKTLLYSDPDDKVYEVRKNINNRNICVTGDNYTGKIPSGTVVLTYRCGGGRRGNLGKGLINEVKSSITYHGTLISLNTINDENSKYGGEEMTLHRAKLVGPSTIFAIDRAVTAQDFVSLLENYPSVLRVATNKTHDSVAIYLLGNGVTTLSREIKLEILEYLKERKVGGDSIISLHDPSFVIVDMIMEIKMKKEFSKSFSTAKKMIEEDLEKFFNPEENHRLTFGKTGSEVGNLFSSDIYNIADDEDKDVEYALLPMFMIRPRINYNKHWPSDSSIKNINISEKYTKVETWTITSVANEKDMSLTKEYHFKVKGSVSGLQNNIAKAGQVYYSDDKKISFFIEKSIIEEFKNNLSIATISVMPIKNEYIQINDSEFPVKGNIIIKEIL